MEINEVVCQQDRLQLIAERRKWQTEVENKKRQLEDDRRALQHLKSKALRERWLLDGAPPAGPEHEEVKRQLEQDEAKTRTLEETINRLEQELVRLETGVMCETITHTSVSSGKPTVEVKDHSVHQQDTAAPPVQVIQDLAEVKVHKSPRMNKVRNSTEEMKRAMYSVEITVERDRLTGETRVLSSQTRLPLDLSRQGVKVYEDDQKVVHEMNGDDVHLLSSSEVEELIHKADEASVMSQTVTAATSLPTAEVQEESNLEPLPPHITAEITGLEAKPSSEPSVAEASAENPVTMVFMGYQNVEDEDETKKVLGLQGTVKAELVLIDDADGKTSPGQEVEVDMAPPAAKATTTPTKKVPPIALPTTKAPPTATAPPTSTKPPEATASNGETAAEAEGGVVAIKKEKQPCKCCSIM
ncbi:paralemmin 1a isoform X1 [Stegastes partitus]|uniref:Paralemmin-1 n=2 Tax=Stegastes partitus TaxID=144197 RepID=A0A9Y4KFJ1_9TELE|nr:PREDICTED: paralemmin-1 isoform X1 [Stegastes partitus]